MDTSQALDIIRGGLLVAMKLSSPVLLLSMGIGIIISIIQAATQIHEQTITFVPKLFAIVAIFLVTGSWMLKSLQEYMLEIFQFMLQ